MHQRKQQQRHERGEMDRAGRLKAAEERQQKWKRGTHRRRHRQPGQHHQRRGNKDDERVRELLQEAILRVVGPATNPEPRMVSNLAPHERRRKLERLRPDMRTEVAPEHAGEQVHETRDDEKPCGKEVQAASPAVLIEDVGGSTGADGTRRVVLTNRGATFEFDVPVVGTDRQLDECRHQIVPRLAPVEPRVSHQDHHAADCERQHAGGKDPVRDPHPSRMSAHPWRFEHAGGFRHPQDRAGCYRKTAPEATRSDVRYAGSRCTVSGEKAGKQTATYSAPSASGVLYRIHSPGAVTTAWPARTSTLPPSCSTRTMPLSTIVISSKAGRWPGSSQPDGERMRATLRA